MKKTLENYADKINVAMERARADFTNQNLLALRIAIDKYLWMKLNQEAVALPGASFKELVEELPKETSIGTLRYKLEFWEMKYQGVSYDPDKLVIVREVQDGGDLQ